MLSCWMLGITLTILLVPAVFSQMTQMSRRCWRQHGRGNFNCRPGSPKFIFNISSGSCELTMRTRCRRGQFMFSTPWGCMRQCACHIPPVYGQCNQNQRRFYYNNIFQICMPFQYSGCGGNQNNFASFVECQFMCTGSDFNFGALIDA